jgi:16S rRNA (adenine1518-N6/adenine1519-N6)-dimethyltransferase
MTALNYNAKTSDQQNELLWEVTQSDEEIGPVTRRECHNETSKPWHRSTQIYLFTPQGEIYFSERSNRKDTGAGLWTVSAGGHVGYGENYADTANRELKEELALEVKLTQIDKVAVNCGTEREVIAIFAGVTQVEPRNNPKEVAHVRSFNYESIVRDFMNNKFYLPGGANEAFKHIIQNGSLAAFRQTVLQA